MKQTSTEFKTLAENPYGARYHIRISDNGTDITQDINDFKFEHTINDDDVFVFGNTASALVTFSIIEPTVNLHGKEITIYQGINVNGTIQEIKQGVFKVLKPKKTRDKTEYQAVDRMTYLMNTPYLSELSYPTTDVAILNEICDQTSIVLANSSLVSHRVDKILNGYTKREIIAYLSQLQGKNAIINSDGNLELLWYNEVDYTIDDNKIYYDGISDVNSETNYTLGYIECTVRNEDGSEETVLRTGNGVTGVRITNPLMTQAILDEVFGVIGGFSFMPAEFEFLGDFRLEVGDIVTVETNNTTYKVPIMQLTHKSDGGVVTTVASIAETDSENEIDMTSPAIKAMDRYYANLVLINQALIGKLSADEADIRYVQTEQLDAVEANVTNAVIGNLSTNFADIHLANIDVADVGLLFNKVGLIDRATIKDGHITGYLDAVEINANKITAGTLIADRILLNGSDKGVLYALNNLGELTSTSVNSLDGYVLTDRTITADKIIAKSITTNELDVNQIFGNTAVLNTIVSQDIFAQAIATNSLVVGAYENAENALDLSTSIKNANGSPILLTDSAESNLIDFKTYGRSIQDGTPTPDAPIDIVSVGEGGTLEVKSIGKNLFDAAIRFNRTANGVTMGVNDSKIGLINGTQTASASLLTYSTQARINISSLSVGQSITVSCKILRGTYIPSNANNPTAFYCDVAGKDTVAISKYKLSNILKFNSTEGVSVFTMTQEMKDDEVTYLYPQIWALQGDVFNNIEIQIQIEFGKEATAYEPYKSSSISIPLAEPLRSIGDVRDEIACIDGVYGVIRRIGSKLFDGSSDENWWKSSGNTVVDEFTLEFDAFMGTNSEMLCSHFAYNRNSNEVGTFRNYHSTAWTQPYQVYVMFAEYGTTTVTKLREWLQANSITIDYILAQETFEPFADQTLFYNIKTFDSITFITATDNAEMKVEYYRNTLTGQQLSDIKSNAYNANIIANNANDNASTAISTANTASTNATNAVSTANTANTNATNALNRATYHYGTCSTAAGTAAKVVSLSGFVLYTGAQVTVQFSKANTAANPTLNVNSTGAKNIRVNNANITSKYYWSANNTVTFVYNGTYWVMSDTSANTILANWCSSNDVTYIDGGKIYTGSITADKINVTDLFSQSIIATGSITGAKLYGTYAEIDEGNIGNWHINDGNMTSLTNDIIFRSTGALDYDLSDVVSTGLYGMSTYVTNGKEKVSLSAGENNVFLEFASIDERERNVMSYQINLYGIEKTRWSSDFTSSETKVILGYLDDGIYTPNLSADRSDILSLYAQKMYFSSAEGRSIIISNTSTALANGVVQNMLGVKYKDAGNQVFTTYPIRVIGSTQTSNYNAGVLLGSNNGTTILASGESSSTMPAKISAYNNEHLYLTSDGTIRMYTGCANDASTYTEALVIANNGATTFTNTVTAPTFSGTATKVQSTVVEPTSESWYAPAFFSGGNTTGGKSIVSNTGISIGFNVGTTEDTGRMTMVLGNKTASGTAGNMRGCLRLYDTNTYYANIYFGNGSSTASRNIYFPDGTGTLALTTSTVENANKLGGKSLLAKNSTDTWDGIPFVDNKGVMEIGKYIDFHTTDGNTADYDVRITASTTGLTLSGTTSGTFKGNLTGNVTGNADTATKVYGTLTNPTSAKTYAIPFHADATSGNKSLLNNDGIRYRTLEGITSENGYGILYLGNDVTTGTAKNKYGAIRMYGTGAYYTQLRGLNATANRTINFPDASGTVSLEGHTHSYLPLSGGTLTGSTILNNNVALFCKNTSGTAVNSLFMDTNNTLRVGYGAANLYIGLHGTTSRTIIFGTRIDLCANANGTSDTNPAISLVSSAGGLNLYFRPTNVSGCATYLGDPTYYFNTVYYATLSQQSDRNVKKDVYDISKKYLDMWDMLQVKTFRYKEDDKTVRVGLIAQDVEECAYKVGLTNEECGFIIKDYVDNENYKGYRYSLDYTGIATITMAKLKQVVDVINTLQDEIAVLKATILHLQQK